MESVIVSITCIALIVIGGMTLSQGYIASVDSNSAAWSEAREKEGEIMRTELSLLTINQSKKDSLELALRNSGQTKLTNFDQWDVIARYYYRDDAYIIKWLPYTEETLDDNEWTIKGIYLHSANATPEVFEPGILNPGEEMIISAQFNPEVKEETTNEVTVCTPNGIQESISFVGIK